MDYLSFIDDGSSEVFLMSIDLFSDAFRFSDWSCEKMREIQHKNSALRC